MHYCLKIFLYDKIFNSSLEGAKWILDSFGGLMSADYDGLTENHTMVLFTLYSNSGKITKYEF